MIQIREFTSADAFETLKSSWDELLEHSPTATPFQTWEWQSTWWSFFGGNKQLRIVTLTDGDLLIGIYPLMASAGPWRSLRPAGLGGSDYLGPLAREGYELQVAVSLADYVRNCSGIDLVDLHQLRETLPLAIELGGVPHARCLVLELPDDFETYLKRLGSSLRYDVRKSQKRLAAGELTLSAASEFGIEKGLDALFELHKRRWRERRLPGAFLGRIPQFHRAWAPLAEARGWLRLSVLTHDSVPIGALYAMSLHRRAYYYQAGFDPAHRSLSPGTLLVAQAIRRHVEEGGFEFDFMRGDEPYKRRWKPQREHANLRLILPRDGLRGATGAGWNRALSRVESRIRAKLEGSSAIAPE